MRATGDKASTFAFGGGSSGGLGELPRSCGVLACELVVTSRLLASEDGFFGGDAAGNLKFWEKEPEAFLVPAGSAGVLGVDMPDVLRPGREGRGNSFKGSCMMGGVRIPPERGE
jgi:hypothetical protein